MMPILQQMGDIILNEDIHDVLIEYLNYFAADIINNIQSVAAYD